MTTSNTSTQNKSKKASAIGQSQNKKNSESVLSFYNPFEKKRRRKTSRAQVKILEQAFYEESRPDWEVREQLAQRLSMSSRRVQIWFQNRRVKEKNLQQKIQFYNKSYDESSCVDNYQITLNEEVVVPKNASMSTNFDKLQTSLPLLCNAPAEIMQAPTNFFQIQETVNCCKPSMYQWDGGEAQLMEHVKNPNNTYDLQQVFCCSQLDGFVSDNQSSYLSNYQTTSTVTPTSRDWLEGATSCSIEPFFAPYAEYPDGVIAECMDTAAYSSMYELTNFFSKSKQGFTQLPKGFGASNAL